MPVRVALPPVSVPAEPAAVVLTGPDGKTFPAQLTRPGLLAPEGTWREFRFILPRLRAGESLTLKATLSTDSPAHGDTFSWHDHAGSPMPG